MHLFWHSFKSNCSNNYGKIQSLRKTRRVHQLHIFFREFPKFFKGAIRCVLRTLSNIYDGVSLKKLHHGYLTEYKHDWGEMLDVIFHWKWFKPGFSSRPVLFCKKGVLRNFAKFTGKKRLWHRCFPVNFAKFLRTLFFTEHLW